MDSLRGNQTTREAHSGAGDDCDPYDRVAALASDTPPPVIDKAERRMQVRAYNHWTGLLGDRQFPDIAEFDPASVDDFAPHSLLLDFTYGPENPRISYLGATLAKECDVSGTAVGSLADIPAGSLLSRITDHYRQILVSEAPIGFEAEFINQRGATILYRGILLPFSSDDSTIDFIYGVINWKELADQQAANELLVEIDQVLNSLAAPRRRAALPPIADWADGPGSSEHGEADGLPAAPGDENDAMAQRLRGLPPVDFSAIAPLGPEFALLMLRRTPGGVVEVLGEVPDDAALIERAARQLLR